MAAEADPVSVSVSAAIERNERVDLQKQLRNILVCDLILDSV
jgi:hypothetical protein